VKVWNQTARTPIAVAAANADVQIGPEISHTELTYLDDSEAPQNLTGTQFEVALSGGPAVLTLSI